MLLDNYILYIQTGLFIYLGLSIGYHVSRAFRDIESVLGEPGFVLWLRKALDNTIHHHDIGIMIIILCTGVYLWTDPLTRMNIAGFLFGVGFAAYWDDKHDAPPNQLITDALIVLKNIITRK